MKSLLKIFLINTVVFLVLSLMVAAITLTEHCGASIPDNPHSFRGYVKYGSSIQASKTVIGTLDGVDFTDTTDSSGWYELDISRCGNSTATAITFTACTRSASETATFSTSTDTATEQNLTILSACPAAAATPSGGGSSGGSSSGGGGGGTVISSEVNLDTNSEFVTGGVTLKQTQGDTVDFTVGGIKYTAELARLKADSVTITIGMESTVLKIGDTAEFDVDGDSVTDLWVTLAGIDGGRAEVVYRGTGDSGMMALLNTIRAFYDGTSSITMMQLLDSIRAFYGG